MELDWVYEDNEDANDVFSKLVLWCKYNKAGERVRLQSVTVVPIDGDKNKCLHLGEWRMTTGCDETPLLCIMTLGANLFYLVVCALHDSVSELLCVLSLSYLFNVFFASCFIL